MTWQWNNNEMAFETERLEGILVAQPEAPNKLSNHRLRALVHKPTGTLVTTDNARGAQPQFGFSLFRVYARNACLTELRATTAQVEPLENGVRMTWQPTLRHQATVTAEFCIRESNAIDLDIRVDGHAHYTDYEILLSNYAAPGFRNGVYVQRNYHGDATPEQIRVDDHPAFHNMYNFFPRDQRAAAILTDGRGQRGRWYWQTAIGREYALPMCFFSDETVDVLMMGRPEDVSAVGVSYNGNEEHDGTADHRGMYLTLFGRDLHAGEGWQTQARLVIDDMETDPVAHQAAYKGFLADVAGRPRVHQVDP